MKQPFVYIMASKPRGTLYTGVTADLIKRVWQHREGLIDGFTKKYSVKMLVWYEEHATIPQAVAREKAIKEWRREWEIELIEKNNRYWVDLYETIMGQGK